MHPHKAPYRCCPCTKTPARCSHQKAPESWPWFPVASASARIRHEDAISLPRTATGRCWWGLGGWGGGGRRGTEPEADSGHKQPTPAVPRLLPMLPGRMLRCGTCGSDRNLAGCAPRWIVAASWNTTPTHSISVNNTPSMDTMHTHTYTCNDGEGDNSAHTLRGVG